MTKKTCPCCGQEKDRSEFGKNKSSKDGLHYYCKECARAKRAKWRAENPDKVREYDAKYYAENREKECEYQAKYRADNAEKCRVSINRSRALKLDRLHPDHNPRLEEALHHKAKVMEKLFGEKFHVDHILPLAKGGYHHHSNLQILPAKINLQKGDSLEWSHPDYFSWRDLPKSLIPTDFGQ